jgi:hypothetical protein
MFNLSSIVKILSITLLFGVFIKSFSFYTAGFRKKRQVLSVLLVSTISSLLLLPFTLFILRRQNSLFCIILIAELIIIFFESLFVYLLNKSLKFKKVFIKVVIINVLHLFFIFIVPYTYLFLLDDPFSLCTRPPTPMPVGK